MRKILLLYVLLLCILSLCKDSKENNEKEKKEVLSLLAYKLQSDNITANTCNEGQFNLVPYISSAISKYNNCNSDSDCAFYTGGYPLWGEKCYIGCFNVCGGLTINSKYQSDLANELLNFNKMYCQGALGSNCAQSNCVASCLDPKNFTPKCVNSKCGI